MKTSPTKFAPTLSELDDRVVPASLSGGVLTVYGTSYGDTLSAQFVQRPTDRPLRSLELAHQLAVRRHAVARPQTLTIVTEETKYLVGVGANPGPPLLGRGQRFSGHILLIPTCAHR